MGLRINTNVASLNAQRALSNSSESQAKSYERLASGQRITSAGDDAAGMSISENLRAQIRSMQQAGRNTNDGISFVQVAEGGLTEVGNILVRLRELTVQAASDTIGEKERGFINDEVQSLSAEVDRIANVTNFNGTKLLSSEDSDVDQLDFQVGIRNDESDRILLDIGEFESTAETLGIDDLDYTDIDTAREAMEMVDDAMSQVFGKRAKLGAVQNKLHSTSNNLDISVLNLQQARSRIADTDIAEETAKLIQGNILQAAGTSVLSQANSAPMAALKLLS